MRNDVDKHQGQEPREDQDLKDHQVQRADRDHLDHQDHNQTLPHCLDKFLNKEEKRDHHPIPSLTCRLRLDQWDQEDLQE